MAECTSLGVSMDDPLLKNYASSILSSVKTTQKHYDTHRSTKQSKRTQRTHDGLGEFSGGVFGIVEGSEKRRLEMEANEEGKGGMCAMEGIDEDDRDRPLQPKESELKLRERELQLPHLPKEHEVPKGRLMCTLQSQAGGSATCETDDHEAGAYRNPVAAQDVKPTRKRIKKEYVVLDGAREGMIVLLEAIKAAHVRARERGGGDNILKRMDLPRFRDGDYCMIKFLQKNDNKKFDAGD